MIRALHRWRVVEASLVYRPFFTGIPLPLATVAEHFRTRLDEDSLSPHSKESSVGESRERQPWRGIRP